MLSLSNADVEVFTSAVNWILHLAEFNSSAPDFSEEERQLLRILLNEFGCQLRYLHFGAESILIELTDKYSCSDGHMQIPSTHFRLIKESVVYFFEQLQHSPTELEALSGLPVSKTSELLTRIQAIQ